MLISPSAEKFFQFTYRKNSKQQKPETEGTEIYSELHTVSDAEVFTALRWYS
jgi:hypothetical protein